MRKFKLTSVLIASAMLCGMLPTVQASADESVETLVKAASDANPDYTVTATLIDLPGETEGVTLFPGTGGYTQIRSTIWEENPDADSNTPSHGGGLGGGYSAYHQQIVLLDPDGEIVMSYDDYGTYGEPAGWGIMPMRYHVDSGVVSLYSDTDLPGCTSNGEYYDLEGNPLFTHPEYVSNSPMINGIAFVRYYEGNELVARLINDKGETVLELPEDFASTYYNYWGEEAYLAFLGRYTDGLFWVISQNRYADTIFDQTGEIGGCGYMDLEGNMVIPQEFDSLFPFYGGLAGVDYYDYETDSVSYGYIDKTGNRVIPMEYEKVSNFIDHYAYVAKDGYYGYIDKDNNTVIPFEYDSAFGEYDNLFTVSKNYSYGMVDKNNAVVVPMIFEDITVADSGVAYAIENLETGVFYRLEISYEGELALGDINGNNEVDSKDAADILIAAAAIGAGDPTGGLTEAQRAAADVNGDGEVDSHDAAIILIYAAAKGAGQKDAVLTDFIS